VSADQLSAALAGWLERLMPAGPRREALIAALAERFDGDERPASPEVCAELQAHARRISRHLDVEWVAEGGLTDLRSVVLVVRSLKRMV